MNVIAVNCGSSTLKFCLVNVESRGRLAYGIVERIGDVASVDFRTVGGEALRQAAPAADHGEATRIALEWHEQAGFTGAQGIDVVGHRVVHGGEHFVEPTVVDDEVVAAIEALTELAPLHNTPGAERHPGHAGGPRIERPHDSDVRHCVPPDYAGSDLVVYHSPGPVDKAPSQRYVFHELAPPVPCQESETVCGLN